MAEGGVGACPQVFVVDSQANYISVPGEKKPRWARGNQKFLLLLLGLTMLGLVVEGCLIYNLYKKTQVRLVSACDSVCLSEGRSLGAWATWKFLFENFPILLYVITGHRY